MKTVWGLPEIQVLIARCHRLSHICLGRGICLLTKASTNFVPAAQPRRCRTFRRFGSAMINAFQQWLLHESWLTYKELLPAYLQRFQAPQCSNRKMFVLKIDIYIYILPIKYGKLYRFDACPSQTLEQPSVEFPAYDWRVCVKANSAQSAKFVVATATTAATESVSPWKRCGPWEM